MAFERTSTETATVFTRDQDPPGLEGVEKYGDIIRVLGQTKRFYVVSGQSLEEYNFLSKEKFFLDRDVTRRIPNPVTFYSSLGTNFSVELLGSAHGELLATVAGNRRVPLRSVVVYRASKKRYILTTQNSDWIPLDSNTPDEYLSE